MWHNNSCSLFFLSFFVYSAVCECRGAILQLIYFVTARAIFGFWLFLCWRCICRPSLERGERPPHPTPHKTLRIILSNISRRNKRKKIIFITAGISGSNRPVTSCGPAWRLRLTRNNASPRLHGWGTWPPLLAVVGSCSVDDQQRRWISGNVAGDITLNSGECLLANSGRSVRGRRTKNMSD